MPPLPQINPEDFEAAVQPQIRQAYDAARDKPDNADTNGRLGMLMHSYQQFEHAEACYRRAQHLAPEEFRWAYYLGVVLEAVGKHPDAGAVLKAALTRQPDYLPAQLVLAQSLLASADLDSSEAIYTKAIQTDPTAAEAFYGLGRVATARKQKDSAAGYYRKACELFPYYGAAHYALALVYRDQGDREKAREHFALNKSFQKSFPPIQDPLMDAVDELNAGARYRMKRGVGLAAAGRVEEAIAEHEGALKIDPDLVQAHVNLVNLYGRLGRLSLAEEHCSAALALAPDLAEIHYDYAVLKSLQGDFVKAEASLKRAIEINPSYPEAHNKYGYLLMTRGQLSEAETHYRLALDGDPNLRESHFNLGRILIIGEKIEESLGHLLKSLTPEDKNTPRYMYALGAAYSRAGDSSEALRYIREARSRAESLGQKELLTLIDRDLTTLEQKNNPP